MRLIYLVKSQPSESAVSLADGRVSCDVTQFESSKQDLWLLAYFTKGQGFEDAKALSEISSGFEALGVEHSLLDDGASAYFEKRLFEQLANFERKLRAVLSIRVALNDSSREDELVSDLEELDFGRLFERLFVDEAFVKRYRELLGKSSPKYEKADLLAKIEKLPETGEWDKLFNEGEAPTIKTAHGFVREMRNKVMHARRMSIGEFRKAKEVLADCNTELDALLEGLPSEKEQPHAFSEALENVLSKRPSEPTWGDLTGANWEELNKRASWADLVTALTQAAAAPIRGSKKEFAALDPELADAVSQLSSGTD